MRTLLNTSVLALALLAGGAVQAQEEVLRLEPGVLELPKVGASSSGKPIYANAYFSPYESLDQRLIAALRQAKSNSTVYMSYYSISYHEYPKVFKELKKRGVKVRLNLYEKEALAEFKKIDDELIAAGFDVKLIPNTRNPKGQGSMHTKFTVVNSKAGWIIVSGSANLSASASLANHEHIVVVASSDRTLAYKYRAEFYEQRRAARAMQKALTEDEWKHFNTAWQEPFPEDWSAGGSTSRAAKLQAQLKKIDRPTKNGNTLVQTWFSPEDKLDVRCREQLKKAKKSIKVAMYTFVNGLVSDLVAAARKGVKVTVIADDHQQDMEFAEWVNEKLEGEPNIRYVRANNHLGLYSSIHHKYAVIDDEIVLGGSYNWTSNATRYNDENLIVVHSKAVAARFAQDFAAMLQEYDPQGNNPPVKVEGDSTRVLFAVAIPFEIDRKFQVFVRVKDTAGKVHVVELRHSRSTGENWLGSADLPRGKVVGWNVGIVKKGGIIGGLNGEGGAEEHMEQTDPRQLQVAKNGLPQIVHERWKGPNPLAD